MQQFTEKKLGCIFLISLPYLQQVYGKTLILHFRKKFDKPNLLQTSWRLFYLITKIDLIYHHSVHSKTTAIGQNHFSVLKILRQHISRNSQKMLGNWTLITIMLTRILLLLFRNIFVNKITEYARFLLQSRSRTMRFLAFFWCWSRNSVSENLIRFSSYFSSAGSVKATSMEKRFLCLFWNVCIYHCVSSKGSYFTKEWCIFYRKYIFCFILNNFTLNFYGTSCEIIIYWFKLIF